MITQLLLKDSYESKICITSVNVWRRNVIQSSTVYFIVKGIIVIPNFSYYGFVAWLNGTRLQVVFEKFLNVKF